MERPWLPLQSICFLPVLWNLQEFKKASKILHLVVIFLQHNHFNSTNWLEEYLIILIPSTIGTSYVPPQFYFYFVHNGLQFGWKYFIPAFLLDELMYTNTTVALWGKHILSIFNWQYFLIPLQSTVSWNLKCCCLLILTDALRKNLWMDKS